MSKNLYRINSKNDLNDLMSESYVKPIGIVFVNNTLELSYLEKLVDLIRKTAKVNNYMTHVIINLDDFEDTTGFFNDIKTKTLPFFISYFLLKEITRHESEGASTTKFLEDYSEIVSGINEHYKNKLITYFTKQQEKQDKSEKPDNATGHTKKTENKSVHSLKSKILKSEDNQTKENKELDQNPEFEQDIELQKQKRQLELLLKQREELEKMEE